MDGSEGDADDKGDKMVTPVNINLDEGDVGPGIFVDLLDAASGTGVVGSLGVEDAGLGGHRIFTDEGVEEAASVVRSGIGHAGKGRVDTQYASGGEYGRGHVPEPVGTNVRLKVGLTMDGKAIGAELGGGRYSGERWRRNRREGWSRAERSEKRERRSRGRRGRVGCRRRGLLKKRCETAARAGRSGLGEFLILALSSEEGGTVRGYGSAGSTSSGTARTDGVRAGVAHVRGGGVSGGGGREGSEGGVVSRLRGRGRRKRRGRMGGKVVADPNDSAGVEGVEIVEAEASV